MFVVGLADGTWQREQEKKSRLWAASHGGDGTTTRARASCRRPARLPNACAMAGSAMPSHSVQRAVLLPNIHIDGISSSAFEHATTAAGIRLAVALRRPCYDDRASGATTSSGVQQQYDI